jgi:prephenate dehydrogenase
VRVAILGVGLIGGSIGLAARLTNHQVRGYDSDPEVLRTALELGAIDEQAPDIATAMRGAEVVFVATPVRTLPEIVRRALELAGPDCVLSDVGSTKQVVASAGADPRFIGGHPLAGAETAGVSNARAELFEGATWYLAPSTHTSPVLYERLHLLLASFGAQPTVIEAETHDHLMASVSHLPHILANVLVGKAIAAGAGSREGEHGRLPATGPSFRDATRVAGANSAIWTDIYLANRHALIGVIDEMQRRLQETRTLLVAGDAAAITAWNERARAEHDLLLGGGLAEEPLHELVVSLPNRPGMIAEIALALGRAGINIAEIEVLPSADDRLGTASLRVRGDERAQRAQELIAELNFPVARA